MLLGVSLRLAMALRRRHLGRTMTTDMTELSRRGRAAYWVVAALAWAGVAATLIITAFDGYAPPTYYEEGLFAGAAHGWAGAPERLINCLSYFTELSNIMVAIISTLLARRGRVGAWGEGYSPVRAHG